MTTEGRGQSPAVALVTGGRRGIGRAIALALAETGMRTAVTSRSLPDGDAELDGLDPAGKPVVAMAMDLDDRASIEAAVESVFARWGRFDVLVNNAIPQPAGAAALICDLDADTFQQILVAQVVNTTYLVQRMLERSRGSGPLTIVNIGSMAGRSRPTRKLGEGGASFSYGAMKAALHQLAPYLHAELAEQGVRAFTVNPGLVRTEALLETLGDVPGAASPRVPAEVVRWLVTSPDADAYLGRYVDAQPLHAELHSAGQL